MVIKLRNDFDSIVFRYFSINLILMTFAVANNRNTSIKDRANSALTIVQHNDYAMNILRLRLPSGTTLSLVVKESPNITKVSAVLLPELRQEIEPELLAGVSTMLSTGKTNTAGLMTYEAALTGAVEREE
jgi:hypothetical protein